MSSFHYIHGNQPDEQRRLSKLNDLLNDASMREMRLTGGERVLDVGCGLAQMTRAMARAAGPDGRVIGVERDAQQRIEAERQAQEQGEASLVEVREGDAVDLPLKDDEWGTFDVVHARFILEHVPDPLAAVRSMLRAARPGGKIIVEDDDHELLRLWPEPLGFYQVWRAYMRAFESLGTDPMVGRHLVALLHEAGARPVRNTFNFFGGCAGSPSFDALIRNFIGIIEGAEERMVSSGHIDAATVREGLAVFEEWGKRPDAAMWYPTCWAEGRRED
jgi:ubiquinone/menaquinone biosynthesis C-methylase UbiE